MRGAINNQGVDEHVIALFTEEIALELRDELKVTSRDRDSVILKYLHKSLRKKYSTFILPFAFLDDYSNLSHYIVLATTSPKGIEVMKSIMSRHSTTDIDGVPSYTYDPRGQLSLLIGSDPIQKLADRILTNYKGELLTRDILYNDDHPKGPYLKKHYNAALKLLEENGDIEIISDSKRKPFTYAEGRVRIRVK